MEAVAIDNREATHNLVVLTLNAREVELLALLALHSCDWSNSGILGTFAGNLFDILRKASSPKREFNGTPLPEVTITPLRTHPVTLNLITRE